MTQFGDKYMKNGKIEIIRQEMKEKLNLEGEEKKKDMINQRVCNPFSYFTPPQTQTQRPSSPLHRHFHSPLTPTQNVWKLATE